VLLAQHRLQHFKATGSTARAASFPEILHNLDEHPNVGGVLLYAVLEHMYVSERVETLRRGWTKLPPGGVLIICETPNRLSYFDRHTFCQPFMNLLPPDLVIKWADHCVNEATKAEIKAIDDSDYSQIRDKFTRMGQSGPSFHEFEAAIGPNVHAYIISGEFDPEFKNINGPYRLEHEALRSVLSVRTPHVHPAFAMPMFYLILRKPG